MRTTRFLLSILEGDTRYERAGRRGRHRGRTGGAAPRAAPDSGDRLDLPRTQETVLSALHSLPLEVSDRQQAVVGHRGAAWRPSCRRRLQPGGAAAWRHGRAAGGGESGRGVRLPAPSAACMPAGTTCTPLVWSVRRGCSRLGATNWPAMWSSCSSRVRRAGTAPGAMIDEGVLTAAGRKADWAYGIHVMSSVLPRGVFAGRPGPLMAASDGLFVRVIGAGGHGSRPHSALDPVQCAAEMVTALQTMVSRRIDAFEPNVITVGTFHAGTRRNIIPDEAVFEATVRSFNPEVREQLAKYTVQVCEGIAAAHGLQVEARYEQEYPVTVNDAAEAAFAADAVRNTFGEERYFEMPTPVTGSEDFSRVLENVPGAYLFLGACTDRRPGQRAVEPLAASCLRRQRRQ